jgi:hypothetical protein
VAGLFGLQGERWMRHANPASVWTRFAVLPALVLSVWSRDWIGWWCLLPVAASIAWLLVNPLFFPPPTSTRNWASKGVLGERIWTERDRSSLPPQFRSAAPNVAQTFQVVGMVPLVVGLVVFEPVAVVLGVLIVQVGKCWFIDRMVLLFDAMKATDPEVAAWDF